MRSKFGCSNGRFLARSVLLIWVLALSAAVTAIRATPPGQQPNIVIFLSDDHGYEFSGAYGHPMIRTPNIDALAKRGVKFTSVFAGSPTCAPSRSILYTGLHSARNGAMGNHTECKPNVKSLPHYLKPLGYRVVLANKTHVKPLEVFPFEYVKATLPPVPTRRRRYRQEGLDVAIIDTLLKDHKKDRPEQPLCLILADNAPHVVWEKNEIYKLEDIPVPANMVDTKMTRTALANYFQDITTMDDRVGKAVESLRKHGYEEDTLFIYTTDQGSEWPHSKWTVYDTGIHVPFIAYWPGKTEGGTVNDTMFSFVDMTPTLVDIAGGDPPQGIDGRSFKDVLLGKAAHVRDAVFAAHTRDGNMNVFPQRGMRTDRYKYVYNLIPENVWTTHFTLVDGIPESHKAVWDTWVEKAKSDSGAAKLVDTITHHPGEELYDVRSDPYELNNIAGKPEMAATLKKMRAAMKKWLEDVGDTDALKSFPE